MNKVPASFRDPSGFIFTHQNQIYRQITPLGLDNYRQFMDSGLYRVLTKKGYIVAHEELKDSMAGEGLTIHPQQIDFISYPYEWSFAQLKDAALLTLFIQMEALKKGQILKDASAYNIQFSNGRPIFIDTLSFEAYPEGKPWTAYRQFCQHFLAPLAMASWIDVRCIKLLMNYIDGIPLDLAASALPFKSRFQIRLLTHLHWHAKTQRKYAGQKIKNKKGGSISKMGMLGLIDHLKSTIKKITWKPKGTEWGDYYTFTNYNETSFKHKKEVVSKWISNLQPRQVWDLGANDGTFSRLSSELGISTVAFDIDPIAVEKNYRKIRKDKEQNLLPLIVDLTNPSPGIGWAHTERENLEGRGPVDLIMALALIHHLCISNNLPFDNVASYFSRLAKYLLIEFVPKGDSQVDILLQTREDIFPSYHEEGFENAFQQHFELIEKKAVNETKRTLFLFKSKSE